MALPPELISHVNVLHFLSSYGQHFQEEQQHSMSEVSLGLLVLRQQYEAAFAEFVDTVIVDLKFTQFIGNVSRENRFSDRLSLKPDSESAEVAIPISLSIEQILDRIQSETPENDRRKIEKIKTALAVMEEVKAVLKMNAEVMTKLHIDLIHNKSLARVLENLPLVTALPWRWIWTWHEKLDEPVIRFEPLNKNPKARKFQEGWYTAAEIKKWLNGEESYVSMKTHDGSISYRLDQ